MATSKQQALLAHCLRSYDYNYVRIDDNSDRYEKSWLYYLSKLPERLEPARPDEKESESIFSEYIEPVVENAVTAITPQVLDIFTEDDQEAVVFRDLSFKPNPVMAEIINKQINRYALQENDGHKILEGALKEALITGDCFTKIYIDEKHEEDKLDLPDWQDMESVISSLAEKQWQCDLPEGIGAGEKKGDEGGIQWRTVTNTQKADPMNPDSSEMPSQRTIELMGTLPIYKVTKKLMLENVGLRDLIIDTNCGDDFSKCRYICHKMTMTVGDAIDLGYKASALTSASTQSRMADAPYNKFNLVTNSQIGSTEQDYEDDGDPLERWITLYEHYIYSSAPTNGKTSRLYQVHTTDSEYLDHTEIKVMPWVHGQVDTIPESFWGRSMYDKFRFYQDELSINQRLCRKNAFNASFNKVLVTNKQYDAESVINSNRPGAIIVQHAQGAIQPWPYQELPQSFGVQQQNLKESLAKTMGQIVGNINTENGISENAAAQTVSMILSQEQMKSKTTAKTFARTYVRPTYQVIYEVLKENGMSVTIPAGTKFCSMPQPTQQDETITSENFPDLYDFNIDINTNGDKAVAARQVASVWQMITQTAPSLATPAAAYKVADEQLKIVNYKAEDFYQDPATIQPTQEEQDLKAAKKEHDLLTIQLLAAQVAKTTSEAGVNETKMGSTVQEAQVKVQVMMTESMAKVKKQLADEQNEAIKRAQDQQAIDFEMMQSAHNIVDKDRNTLINAHKVVNGVKN